MVEVSVFAVATQVIFECSDSNCRQYFHQRYGGALPVGVKNITGALSVPSCLIRSFITYILAGKTTIQASAAIPRCDALALREAQERIAPKDGVIGQNGHRNLSRTQRLKWSWLVRRIVGRRRFIKWRLVPHQHTFASRRGRTVVADLCRFCWRDGSQPIG